MDRLGDYLTERGNPANQKNVSKVRVEMPAPFPPRGLEFVDTPDIGSSNRANSDTTYDFLAKSDAVLYATSVDTPLTQPELTLLQAVRRHVNKIFSVVNKMDLLAGEEREEVLAFISHTLQRQMDVDKLKIFPFSARQGLSADRSGDAAGYLRSGLQALEDALGDFLSCEKGTTFLLAATERTLRLVEELSRRAGSDTEFQGLQGMCYRARSRVAVCAESRGICSGKRRPAAVRRFSGSVPAAFGLPSEGNSK